MDFVQWSALEWGRKDKARVGRVELGVEKTNGVVGRETARGWGRARRRHGGSIIAKGKEARVKWQTCGVREIRTESMP